MTNVDMVITRHRGAAEWVAQQFGGTLSADGQRIFLQTRELLVYADASLPLVSGMTVVGNLPLWLAAACRAVGAIEFDVAAPRGAEYTADDMVQAGARIRWYRVTRLTHFDIEDETQ